MSCGFWTTLMQRMRESPHLAGVEQLYGRKNLHYNGDAPQVVWCPPPTESFSTSSREVDDGTVNNPRPLFVRRVMVEAHCWARAAVDDAPEEEHDDAADELAQRAARAVYAQTWSGYFMRPGSGRRVDAASWEKRGSVYISTFDFQVAVVDARYGEIAIGSEPGTGIAVVTITPTVVPP